MLLFISTDDDDDKAKVIVGVVVGLIVAAALVGIIYWLYMRNRYSINYTCICGVNREQLCGYRDVELHL